MTEMTPNGKKYHNWSITKDGRVTVVITLDIAAADPMRA
jgi:hypothetical protein